MRTQRAVAQQLRQPKNPARQNHPALRQVHSRSGRSSQCRASKKAAVAWHSPSQCKAPPRQTQPQQRLSLRFIAPRSQTNTALRRQVNQRLSRSTQPKQTATIATTKATTTAAAGTAIAAVSSQDLQHQSCTAPSQHFPRRKLQAHLR